MPPAEDIARLVVSCRDRHGIVAALSTALSELGANIVSSGQHSTDPENGMFFLRMEFHLPGLAGRLEEANQRLEQIAEAFEMNWSLTSAATKKRVAIFVSKQDHCLSDLLWRWQRRELPMELACVISNHPDHRGVVEALDVPFHHIPVTRETKAAAEARQLQLLANAVDLVILARYMQVLSPEFLATAGFSVINIHHSFLPAFVGQNPYARAYARGVKLIGATAHYATPDLDEGPIIEQDVQRVWHVHTAADLTRVGRDIERLVLARAVLWHLEDRVIVHGNRTVVFLN
jgi:formyltetrahydrofolate deformylase